MHLLLNHDFIMAVLGLLLAISELLPFLNVKPSGILEAVILFIQKVANKK